MLENFKISCELVLGSFAKDIFYEFNVVFTKESIIKNGYQVGVNFVVIKGNIIDDEEKLKKFHCNESKWKEEMALYLNKDNAKNAIVFFKQKTKIN